MVHLLEFGFRQGCSKIQALSKIVGNVDEGLEEENRLNLTMCDPSKDFDCISNDLLKKQFRYGFTMETRDHLDRYGKYRAEG